MNISPLAPTEFSRMPDVKGVALKMFETRMVYKNRDDLLLAQFAKGTQVAGVFTQSKTCSAAVDWCKKHLATGHQARLLLVNAGNSNAFTGAAGERSVTSVFNHLAQKFKLKNSEIYTASTGVIGELLSADDLLNAVDANKFSTPENNFIGAANAIRTTDTFAKFSSRQVEIAGNSVTINAIAKGSGMIAPDMSTMLSFIFTDANISQPALQKILVAAVKPSFNAITVDSDTSTSDTVLLFATGQLDAPQINDSSAPELQDFVTAINELCLEMAQYIVRDGEGAQKFITVNIGGAVDDQAAHNIGMSIANSPLVKTAIAGEDANWGRIIMAIGKSGEQADRDLIEITIGGIKITQNGQVVKGYDEAPVTRHMQTQNIIIDVSMGLSDGQATVYTCDLTHGYITINADYRS
ncbi:MAG: bifunctional glutamate N-acetyltransferase/amino-acid acetyltransferase ArgJ [Rhizobiales bacterium]|nr:bifunctional glutamate N-acetyltransferase/amino-acid acetyltransferase ArgJ [Hyphomicrobiales bacterium]NRB15691.1 bifunctional glutamate N-acetyltransferase/amino-acid acetyltransferase ArgJ [Hyphomicrobiales bacterium]